MNSPEMQGGGHAYLEVRTHRHGELGSFLGIYLSHLYYEEVIIQRDEGVLVAQQRAGTQTWAFSCSPC